MVFDSFKQKEDTVSKGSRQTIWIWKYEYESMELVGLHLNLWSLVYREQMNGFCMKVQGWQLCSVQRPDYYIKYDY